MQHTVFIGPGCHQCQDVVEWLKANRIPFRLIHVSKEQPPVDVFAFPALFEGERLLAYGMDIVTYFEKRLEKPAKKPGLLASVRILLARVTG